MEVKINIVLRNSIEVVTILTVEHDDVEVLDNKEFEKLYKKKKQLKESILGLVKKKLSKIINK